MNDPLQAALSALELARAEADDAQAANYMRAAEVYAQVAQAQAAHTQAATLDRILGILDAVTEAGALTVVTVAG